MNSIPIPVTSAIAAALLSAVAASQQPATVSEHTVVPIHSHPDDPAFGAYGVWAGGLGYKVRFDDAVSFVARLGQHAPRNLPLVWRTIGVRIGTTPLVDAATVVSTRVASPVRFEYHRGPVVEAYDVRAEGVEQTFVLAARPPAVGDLVVEGTLETELVAPPAADRHADLDFVEPQTGRTAATYGRAFVVDGSGRKQAICTGFDGRRVRLCVPRAFLEDAVFPVTIDPLTSSRLINLDGYLHADVGTQSETGNQTRLVAHSLWTSATDIDMIVYSMRSDWTGDAQLFADLADGWHSNHPAVAYSAGANRWVVAFERQNTASRIRLYVHARDDTGFNTGQLSFMSQMASGSQDWKADVGAQAGSSSTLALIVCQSEFGSQFDPTGPSEVFGRVVDLAIGQAAAAAQPLAGSVSSAWDREGPTVTALSHGSSYWQTAWSQRTGAGKFAIHTAQVDVDSTVRPAVRIDDPALDFHKVAARIDGRSGEFLVTYVLATDASDDYGRSLHASRFRNRFPQITEVRHHSLVAAQATETVANGGLAFDGNTESHWGVAWHRANGVGTPMQAFVARVGYEARITEQQELTATGQLSARPVVAFSALPPQLVVVDSEFNAIRARELLYPGEAGVTVFGPGCGGTIGAANPYAGNANFYVNLGAAPPGQSAVPLLALGQSAVPLDFLGMAGCVLHLAPASLVTLAPRQISLLRIVGVNVPLPESFVADLYAQWLFTDPSAPGGARVSPAARIRVR